MNLITLSVLYKVIADAMSRMSDGTSYSVRGCAPTAQGVGTLQVNVAAGEIVTNGTPRAYLGGNITPAAADGVLPRRDIVYFTSAGALATAAGTPAASNPIPPALPSGAVLIAVLAIPAAATDYSAGGTTGYVEDARQTRVGDVIAVNVKAFGATGDGRSVSDAAITTGTPTLTSASNPWTTADVGKLVTVAGAGAAGVVLATTIAAFVNAGTVTLTANASTTVSAKLACWGTDDTTAIASAITAAAGGKVVGPPGVYSITSTLVLATEGSELLFGGMSNGKSVLRAMAAVNGLRVSAGFCKVADLELDGNGIGLTGIIWHNAGRTVASRVYAHNWTADGQRLDISFTTPTGNNNFLRFEYCRSSANTGKGYSVPSYQSDNNGIVFLDSEAQGNTSHGLLFKGVNARVFGGQFSANGGYGIMLGETADASTTTDCGLFYPWLEGNTAGAVGGNGGSPVGKSARNLLFRNWSGLGLDVANAGDTELGADTGALGGILHIGQGIGVGSVGFSAAGNYGAILAGSKAWTPGAIAAGAQVSTTLTVTGAHLSDTVIPSYDQDLVLLQLTAYVSVANTVTFILHNGTAGSITPAAGNVRADVLRH